MSEQRLANNLPGNYESVKKIINLDTLLRVLFSDSMKSGLLLPSYQKEIYFHLYFLLFCWNGIVLIQSHSLTLTSGA